MTEWLLESRGHVGRDGSGGQLTGLSGRVSNVDISAPAGCSLLPTLHLSASCSLAPGTGTSAPNAFFLSLIQGSRSVAALQAPLPALWTLRMAIQNASLTGSPSVLGLSWPGEGT